MDIRSPKKSKNVTNSEDDVVTQVQHILPDGPDLATNQSSEPLAKEAAVCSNASDATNTKSATNCIEEASDYPAGGTEDECISPSAGTAAGSAGPPSSGKQSAELAAGQDSGQQLDDVPPGSTSPAHSDRPSLTDARRPPTDDVTSSQQSSDVTDCQQLSGDGERLTGGQKSTQARLQDAIDKVEQLDRSLEKKLKENLEAKAVTADLRALVRRELAELSGSGGRHATREESDNTLQFIRVLVDNDTESESSSRRTPIFQTQLRLGGAAAVAATDPGPPAASGDPTDPTAVEPPPPPPPPPTHSHLAHDQNFIRRNIELAQEAGGSLAMTEHERSRLEQLLHEDEQLENAFSVDQQQRRMLDSLDDRLSSLGASVAAAPVDSSYLVSQPTVGGEGGGAGDGDAADPERDYLEATRHDRETTARLETLHRLLQQLAAPVEARHLERSDVDSMIRETIASLVSVPGAATSDAGTSVASAPTEMAAADAATAGHGADALDGDGSEEGEGESEGEGAAEDASEAGEAASVSDVATEATLDVRSVLSGTRLLENERQLAAELRPGSPTAWLLDVNQGPHRVQLVVPRLSRQLISSLLESSSVLPPDQRPASVLTRPVSAGAD